MDASLLHFRTGHWTRLLLLASVLVFAFAVTGCGGNNEDVADDPGAVDSGIDDLDDDSPPDRSFESDDNVPFDRDTPDADDLNPAELPPQLQDIFFGFDKFELDAESRSVLQENAELLREADWKILVEGHCDERGTAQYNMALGWKRANEIMRYLVSLGIAADRIETVSYGKERPFVTGQGEEIWAQNRRAHFAIQNEGR
jgi:peptidoglycan-associated lipoprotein